MRSIKVFVCVAFALSALACSKSKDDGNSAGTSGGTAGAGSSGTGATEDGGLSNVDAGGGTAGTQASGDAGDVDSSMSPPIDAPPAITDLANAFADGVCGALVDCVGAAKLRDLVGGEDCETRVSAEFLSGEFAYLQTSIDDKRVKLDESMVEACVTGIKALGCKIETDSFPAACEKAVEGTVAVGDECTITSDCAGTAFCEMQGCPARCAALLESGDACHKDEECGDDLICLAGKCETPVRGTGTGECEGTSGKRCALGYSCWNSSEPTEVDDGIGTCHDNAETLSLTEGTDCEPGSKLCKEGLSCVYYEAGAKNGFHCEKPVSSGAKCHLGLPGQCPSNEYCDAASFNAEGDCQPRPVEGEACVGNGVCAAGFACVPSSNTTGGVCRRIQNNGGACKIDAACRSKYCSAAKCEPPPVCTE